MEGTPSGQVPCHVAVCFFHVIFKLIAAFVYLFSSLLSESFVMIFIICIVTLAVDFWVVKNVSGRKLVGLRWWNETSDEGQSQWLFESLDETRLAALNSTDKKVFWYTMIATPVLWLVITLWTVLTIKVNYLIIAAVALSMNGANTYGYFKCSKEAKQQVAQLSQQAAATVAQQAFRV